MRKLVLGMAFLLVACGTPVPGSTTTTTTTTIATAVGPDLDLLRSMYEGTSNERVLEGLNIVVTGDTVQVNTGLPRDQEAAPSAAGLCLAVGDAGAIGEIEVYASDGGLMASTKDGICRLVPSLSS